ncbi:MAG: ABC transporter permease subunit [Phycisphaerales bacterium]
MRRIWAVATNTIRQALRMKVAVVFIVLLLVLLPVMGYTASGDGTLRGRLQTFVSYGLSLTSLLLSLLTIIVSIYSITSDIEYRQIYTVVTKPIRRYQLILGKFLGVVVLDVALLTLFSGIVYGFIALMPKFVKASDEELTQIGNEFFTARASLVPPQIDVSKEVEEVYAKLQANDQLEIAYPNSTREEIRKYLTSRIRLEKRAAAIGSVLIWEFNNVRPSDPNHQSLFIRFKYDVSVTPPDEQVYGDWRIGDLRGLQTGTPVDTPVWRVPRKDPVRKFREIEVPASAVAKDGYLAVGFMNPPLNSTVVLFPVEDGLEVLYKADTFLGNYVRAALLILFRLVFLACLGVMAASFLSFPVAILFCLVIFVTGATSGGILESFGYMSRNVSLVYRYTIEGIIYLLPQFDKFNPTQFLVPARLIPWSLIGKVVLVMVCLKAALLLALALIIFSFRELAKVVV